MSKVISKVRQGRVEFIAPSDWPEGSNVESSQVSSTNYDDLMSKEEIEQTLKARDEYFSQVFDQAAHQEIQNHINEMRKRDKEQAIARLDKISKGWD
ncbi:MAG: hypothetical protein JNJ77_19490 [Planctomycetia bacterium]|nr:hypothetical protein [Planctomycetia bacterium]